MEYQDITFVVQGPVTFKNNIDITLVCLKSIEKNYPHSKIIFSTWENQILNSEYDLFKVIRNVDPGSGYRDKNKSIFNNINRQIISSLNGIRLVETKYAVKVRSDIYFNNNNLVSYISKYNNYDIDYKFLKERVIVTNVTSINPKKKQKLPFHPCDWIYFGLKEDLECIFTIPLVNEPEFSDWFLAHKIPASSPFNDITARYSAENYIWSNFLRKFVKIEFENLADLSDKNIELTDITFANNLIILSPKKLGILNLKTNLGKAYSQYTYSFNEWKKIYNKYAFGKEYVPIFDIEIFNTFLYRIKNKLLFFK